MQGYANGGETVYTVRGRGRTGQPFWSDPEFVQGGCGKTGRVIRIHSAGL